MTYRSRTAVGRRARTAWSALRCSLFLVSFALLADWDGVAQTPEFITLHSFTGNPDGAVPYGGVSLGQNGTLYGTTYGGGPNLCSIAEGTYSCGTVFTLTPVKGGGWTESVIFSFSGADGAWPAAGVTFGTNGKLYGTTEIGGGGGGTVFELTPPSVAGGTWTQSVPYTFPSGRGSPDHTPEAAVLVFPNGTLYTTATTGSAIQLAPPTAPGRSWREDTIFTFGYYEPEGSAPYSGFVSVGGTLYGTTYFGSDEYCGFDSGCGAVYALEPPPVVGGAWTGISIHSFTGNPDGESPFAELTDGPGGILYGTTYLGGSGAYGAPCYVNGGGCGTVFQLTPPAAPGGVWTETVIYSFSGLNGDGAYPSASVVLGKNGALYGATQYGGDATANCSYYGASGCGTVFELTPPALPGEPWTETILHSFTGQNGDGAVPMAGLTLSVQGVLYGATSAGGSAGLGTVFSIKP